jgi:hypothetical protein
MRNEMRIRWGNGKWRGLKQAIQALLVIRRRHSWNQMKTNEGDDTGEGESLRAKEKKQCTEYQSQLVLNCLIRNKPWGRRLWWMDEAEKGT